MFDTITRITDLRLERGWTEYALAERSGITQSTISSWYRKNSVPTIASVERICEAYEITLSQFFAYKSDSISLTEIQFEMLESWNKLEGRQRAYLLKFLQSL